MSEETKRIWCQEEEIGSSFNKFQLGVSDNPLGTRVDEKE